MQTPAFNLFIKRWSESVIREVEHAQKRKDKPKLRRICSVSNYCYPFASFKSSNKYKRNEYRGPITKERKYLNEPELLWYKRNKNALLVIISHYKKAKTETDPEKLCFFKMTGIPRHRKHFRVAMMTCLLAILLPTTASRLAINAFDHLRNKTKSKIYFPFHKSPDNNYMSCSFITCDGRPATSLGGHFQNLDSFLEGQVIIWGSF